MASKGAQPAQTTAGDHQPVVIQLNNVMDAPAARIFSAHRRRIAQQGLRISRLKWTNTVTDAMKLFDFLDKGDPTSCSAAIIWPQLTLKRTT